MGVFPATKHGLHFVGGYRFTKRWYVGGIAGVEATTPFTIIQDAYAFESYNFEMPREDKIYGSLMLDVRFYMNIARASTYLFTNFGAEYSRDLQKIGTFGLGIDIHTTKSQCVNIGLGLGLGGWHSAHNGDIIDEGPQHGYGPYDGFVCNIKLGYTF